MVIASPSQEDQLSRNIQHNTKSYTFQNLSKPQNSYKRHIFQCLSANMKQIFVILGFLSLCMWITEQEVFYVSNTAKLKGIVFRNAIKECLTASKLEEPGALPIKVFLQQKSLCYTIKKQIQVLQTNIFIKFITYLLVHVIKCWSIQNACYSAAVVLRTPICAERSELHSFCTTTGQVNS